MCAGGFAASFYRRSEFVFVVDVFFLCGGGNLVRHGLHGGGFAASVCRRSECVFVVDVFGMSCMCFVEAFF